MRLRASSDGWLLLLLLTLVGCGKPGAPPITEPQFDGGVSATHTVPRIQFR